MSPHGSGKEPEQSSSMKLQNMAPPHRTGEFSLNFAFLQCEGAYRTA